MRVTLAKPPVAAALDGQLSLALSLLTELNLSTLSTSACCIGCFRYHSHAPTRVVIMTSLVNRTGGAAWRPSLGAQKHLRSSSPAVPLERSVDLHLASLIFGPPYHR